jgi:hypothetical protein
LKVSVVIQLKVLLKVKITYALFIDKKLNVTVKVNLSDAFNLSRSHYAHEPEFIYYGKGEVLDDILKVRFLKKEERALNGSFTTYFYPKPFIAEYLVTKNDYGTNCIVDHFNPSNDHMYKGVDQEIWTYDYWLYTPKEIRRRDKKRGLIAP